MFSADSPRVTQAPAGVSMPLTGKQPSDGGVTPLLKPENSSSANLFWICLAAWTISFLLPAARYQDWGPEETMFGWEAAFTALTFFFMPVKGMWFGFDPHVWSVFVNFFMLWAPFRIKRLNQTKGRGFAIAFAIATFVPVGLVFIPESFDLATIRGFEAGFVLWALSMLGASAWFSWTAWGKGMALLPNVVLAATLFCGLFIWSPILQGRQRRAEQEREEAAKQAPMRQEQAARNAAALEAIAQHGLMAFTEPMSDTEEWYLEYHIRGAPKFTPAELTEAAEYYQNPKIMMALAENLKTSAKALEILYRHTSEKEKASRSEAVTAQQLYFTIAANPNASPDLLLKMLRSGNSGQRTAALRSGNLPSKQKMDYLERGCTLTDDDEMAAVARDTDTPVEVLECLSPKPGAAVGLSINPHAPTSVLEQMSQSPDWRIANYGKIGLTQRKRQGK
jgi:hypothetical protein